MKRLLAKILFSVVLINTVAHIDCAPVAIVVQPSWASWLKSGATTVLQGLRGEAKTALRYIAKNPGWTSLVIGAAVCNMAFIARYKLQTAKEKKELAEKEVELKELNNPAPKQDDVQPVRIIDNVGPQNANQKAAADAFGQAQPFENQVRIMENANKQDQAKKLSEEINQLKNTLSDKLYWTKLVCAGTTLATAAFAGMGIFTSKVCRWVGSKL